MPYFQNPFMQDFHGSLLLGDRKLILTYDCPMHAQRGMGDVVSSLFGPTADLTGNDGDGNPLSDLTLAYALDPELKAFAEITVDVTAEAAAPAATTPQEIVNSLNADSSFTAFFEAKLKSKTTGDQPTGYILITSKRNADQIKFYILNTGAETVLRFNARAGVKELPTYFSRHTVANIHNFPDSVGLLIELDPSNAGGASAVDDDIIDNAVDEKGKSLGYSSSTVQDDWQLLAGNSGIFNFQKITVDGSDRITEIIEYPAGAAVGGFAKKIKYVYTGANTNPDQVTEEPYVLTSSDLVTP
jgi:hypothetical protein